VVAAGAVLTGQLPLGRNGNGALKRRSDAGGQMRGSSAILVGRKKRKTKNRAKGATPKSKKQRVKNHSGSPAWDEERDG